MQVRVCGGAHPHSCVPSARQDGRTLLHGISKTIRRVVVFQVRRSSHLYYTSTIISQRQTRALDACLPSLPLIPTPTLAS
jgi:hypothetical protein